MTNKMTLAQSNHFEFICERTQFSFVDWGYSGKNTYRTSERRLHQLRNIMLPIAFYELKGNTLATFPSKGKITSMKLPAAELTRLLQAIKTNMQRRGIE